MLQCAVVNLRHMSHVTPRICSGVISEFLGDWGRVRDFYFISRDMQ